MTPAGLVGPAQAGEPSGQPPGAQISGRHGAAVRTAIAVLTPLILMLGVLGGIGSFTTIRDMAEPWFGELAWIVPVGMDVGIFLLLAWDLLMEHLALPWPVLRWVAWTFIAGTVTVNVLAAAGDAAGIVMHAAMPVLFITVVEGVRHLIRQWVGLATGTRIERIPVARWLLAPLSTALLWRRMVLWHITTYRRALELEYRHLLAVSHLQRRYGRWAWRWHAPLADRIALRRLPAEMARPNASSSPCSCGLETAGPPEQAVGRPASSAEELLKATCRILLDAERQGVRLSQAGLGRRLRTMGFSIANDRLAALREEAHRRMRSGWNNMQDDHETRTGSEG